MSDFSAVLEEPRWSDEEEENGSDEGLQPCLLSHIVQEAMTTPTFQTVKGWILTTVTSKSLNNNNQMYLYNNYSSLILV